MLSPIASGTLKPSNEDQFWSMVALRKRARRTVPDLCIPALGRPSHAYFDLLVNFFTATRKSSVCIEVMILCSSASSCCLVGVVAA